MNNYNYKCQMNGVKWKVLFFPRTCSVVVICNGNTPVKYGWVNDSWIDLLSKCNWQQFVHSVSSGAVTASRKQNEETGCVQRCSALLFPTRVSVSSPVILRPGSVHKPLQSAMLSCVDSDAMLWQAACSSNHGCLGASRSVQIMTVLLCGLE